MSQTSTRITLYPNTKLYTFLSSIPGTLSKTEHILGNKASLKKYRKTEITPYILYDHNNKNLDVDSNRNYRRHTNS